MSNKKKNQPIEKIGIPEGHRPPVTRRDFLKFGVIPFAGTVLVPNLIMQILSRATAHAQTPAGTAGLCGAGSAGYIPFLVFDMAGGAALPGNFLVGKKGGPEDLLGSYDTLGWNPKNSGAIDKSFGVPMAGNNVSQILAGIKQTASAGAQANLRMGTFCHFSQDDSQANRTSALTLVARAGLQGKFVQNGVGSINSLSGGNSDVALKEAMYKPNLVQNAEDISRSVSNGPAFEDMSDADIRQLSQAIYNMSALQLKQFEGLSDGQKLAGLSDCGYKTNLSYGKIIQGLDHRRDSTINATQVYQNAQVSDDKGNGNQGSEMFASIAYNVISGNVGPGAITIGGCDYHDGNSVRGNRKDLDMGRQIGAAVELAFRMKKPLFFQLVTDGGVTSSPGTRDWTADSSLRSLTVIGYYNPNKAPEQRRLQVGEYTDGGTVNQNTLIGDDPSKVANAVLANYLSACGKIGEFEKTAQIAFRNADLDSVLIF